MRITTGIENHEILDTGSIITFNDEPLKFELAPGLCVIIKFKQDKSFKEQKMDFQILNENELELVLTNFNSSLGTGNVSPLPLAKLEDKIVYLNFTVYALDESSNKIIHYTWYSRKEVING